MRSWSSIEVEILISQIHRIRTDPQRDHMTFVQMERELGVMLFFQKIDFYSYRFRQECIKAKYVLSIDNLTGSLIVIILEICKDFIPSTNMTELVIDKQREGLKNKEQESNSDAPGEIKYDKKA